MISESKWAPFIAMIVAQDLPKPTTGIKLQIKNSISPVRCLKSLPCKSMPVRWSTFSHDLGFVCGQSSDGSDAKESQSETSNKIETYQMIEEQHLGLI